MTGRQAQAVYFWAMGTGGGGPDDVIDFAEQSARGPNGKRISLEFLELAQAAAEDSRNNSQDREQVEHGAAVLARAAIVAYTGDRGPPNAARMRAMLEEMGEEKAGLLADLLALGSDAHLAIYYVQNAASLDPEMPAAREFARRAYLSAGLPVNPDHIAIMARELARAMHPGDPRLQASETARLRALASDPIGKMLFEQARLREEMFNVLKDHPEITAESLEHYTRAWALSWWRTENPWLMSAVADARAQTATQATLKPEDYALRTYKIADLDDMLRAKGVKPENVGPLHDAILRASAEIGADPTAVSLMTLPIFKTTADGTQKQDWVFLVDSGVRGEGAGRLRVQLEEIGWIGIPPKGRARPDSPQGPRVVTMAGELYKNPRAWLGQYDPPGPGAADTALTVPIATNLPLDGKGRAEFVSFLIKER
jgi:hypothetical protein